MKRIEGWLAALIVVPGALAIDAALVSIESGIAAVVVMVAVTSWIAGAAGLRLRDARRVSEWRSLLRIEALLTLGCCGFVLARAVMLYRQFLHGPGPTEDELTAVRLYDLVFLALALGGELLLWRARLFARLLFRLGRRPHLLLAASFAGMIATGTLALCLPWSVRDVAHISLLDSLFTMTSAVCVTGLVVNDVGSHYTLFGQVVILLGIQFGGIGIMTLGAAALTLRRDASFSSQARFARMLEVESLQELRGIVRTVVSSTLVIEVCGALLLWWFWRGEARFEGRSVPWLAAFHTVSAFCNAGFALFPENLVGFAGDVRTQAVVAVLIVLGGLGFPVYLELGRRALARLRSWIRRRPHEPRKFALGPRVVLLTTSGLIVFGSVGYAVLEWNRALAHLGGWERCAAAVFGSVTARTAGFNTIDYASLSVPSQLLTMLLMWIGGSPSSMAGGVKTTTIAVLLAISVGEMRGHEPRLGGRRLGPETLRRATAVAALSLCTLVAVVFALSLTERQDVLALAFESVSALATVGLSTGVTPTLSSAGRVIVVLAMFVGRIGPMTVALAIGRARAREPFRLPTQELGVW